VELDFDPETGISAYMHCTFCLEQCPPDQSPAEFARLSIGASPQGDLIVWCNRHGVCVTRMRNDEIGEAFFKAGGVECSCCGKGEKAH
jgi:hypothetical protein